MCLRICLKCALVSVKLEDFSFLPLDFGADASPTSLMDLLEAHYNTQEVLPDNECSTCKVRSEMRLAPAV